MHIGKPGISIFYQMYPHSRKRQFYKMLLFIKLCCGTFSTVHSIFFVIQGWGWRALSLIGKVAYASSVSSGGYNYLECLVSSELQYKYPHRYWELPHPFFYYNSNELRELYIQIRVGLKGPLKCSAPVGVPATYTSRLGGEPLFTTDVLSPQV